MHFALSTAAILYVVLLYWLRPAERSMEPIVVVAISFACLGTIGVALFYRSRMVDESAAQLVANPQDSAQLNRWRTGVLVSLTCAESVVLFGFMLKILGARWSVAGVFFVVGILLLLVWTPKLDLPSES